MNEIYRVLKPNGKFYAITPVYPKESAFVDPTHVNFITQNTHKYFTYPHNWASMYGFEGSFALMQSKLVNFDLEVNKHIWYKLIAKRILNIKSRQHIKWEFCALK